jgi:hypothetical protein
MKAVTVQETESIRPTSIETKHTTIHIKGKHYLQFHAALGFFLSALPRVKKTVDIYAESTSADFSATHASFISTSYCIPIKMTHGCD